MPLQKILLSAILLLTVSCTEDLGTSKLNPLGNTPQEGPPSSTPIGWSTKLTYQLNINNDAVANGGGIDQFGNWYSVGYAMNAGVKSWIVQRSTNKGLSWTVVDQFNYSPGQESIALGFAADKNGNVYVVGEGIINMGTPQYYWIVRRSTDSGQTWTTVDSLTGAPGFYNEAAAVTVNSNGRVFVTGVVHDGTKFEWLLRSSPDAGMTWSTVSTYASNNHARGYAVTVDKSNNVYACGSGMDNNNKNHWIIVKSTDNGTSWNPADNFQLHADGDAECKVLALDASGRIFAGGFGVQPGSGKHWIVKRSNADGSAWAIRDDYTHPADSATDANSSARAIAFDNKGFVYVAGFGSTFMGAQKYILVVRKSVNGGTSWTTEDAFQPVANRDEGLANSIAIDSENRIFVGGGGWIGSWGWFIRGNY